MKLILEIIFVSILINLIDAKYRLVFKDEFNGKALDKNKWKYETGGEPKWGNNELQFYTQSTKNVMVRNGKLIIRARPQNMGGRQFTSARINSKQSWAYGVFKIRAKLPKGKNLWPAIWLLPRGNSYGGWPASGEIDIVEARGERSDTVQGTIHYGGDFPNHNYTGSPETKFSDLSQGFHTYTLYWGRKMMKWSVDGKVYYKLKTNRNFWSGKGRNPYTRAGQPFDKPFYFVLNVAVGGNFFPQNIYGKPVTREEARRWPKPRMEIDYIRVYQKV